MNVGSGSQKKADNFDMTHGGSRAQGLIMVGMDIGTSGQENANDVGMPFGGSHVQRPIVIGMNVNTGSQKKADNFSMTMEGCRTQDAAPGNMDVKSGSQDEADDVGMTAAGRTMQGLLDVAEAGIVGLVWVGNLVRRGGIGMSSNNIEQGVFDTHNIADVDGSNQCVFLLFHATIITATATAVKAGLLRGSA